MTGMFRTPNINRKLQWSQPPPQASVGSLAAQVGTFTVQTGIITTKPCDLLKLANCNNLSELERIVDLKSINKNEIKKVTKLACSEPSIPENLRIQLDPLGKGSLDDTGLKKIITLMLGNVQLEDFFNSSTCS